MLSSINEKWNIKGFNGNGYEDVYNLLQTVDKEIPNN